VSDWGGNQRSTSGRHTEQDKQIIQGDQNSGLLGITITRDCCKGHRLMKLFKVVGSVTLSRCHPSYDGGKFLAVEPEGEKLLGREPAARPDLLVAWDERGAGVGSTVAISDGGEASQAFRPELKPVDAYISAILDTVTIDSKVAKQIG